MQTMQQYRGVPKAAQQQQRLFGHPTAWNSVAQAIQLRRVATLAMRWQEHPPPLKFSFHRWPLRIAAEYRTSHRLKTGPAGSRTCTFYKATASSTTCPSNDGICLHPNVYQNLEYFIFQNRFMSTCDLFSCGLECTSFCLFHIKSKMLQCTFSFQVLFKTRDV